MLKKDSCSERTWVKESKRAGVSKLALPSIKLETRLPNILRCIAAHNTLYCANACTQWAVSYRAVLPEYIKLVGHQKLTWQYTY